MSERTNKRISRRGDNTCFIGAWVPPLDVQKVDQAAKILDLDRSKFLRRALREKVEKTLGQQGHTT